METSKSKFNKRRPEKRVSDIGRVQRHRVHHRTSLAKSIGKLRKGEQETPIVAIQQTHLLRKQRAFLVKQAFVFEKKAETVREQVKVLEVKIKAQKELAVTLMKDLEEGEEPIDMDMENAPSAHRSKPEKTIGQQGKKIFRLGY
jgi:hypothetical protein